jgi:ribosomal protein S12 methylthiotransferase
VAAHAGEARVPVEGVRLTPRHYAYLKVSEGCNHKCSFCIIPQMRGRLASRPLPEVLEEAERLVATGVRELLVISQDTSAYGVDRRFEPVFHNGRPLQTRFQDLVAALSELGVWVRLHYVYPYPHVDQVIPQMGIGGLLPYLDVPLQHGSPRILKAMRRPAATENTLERIQRWRDTCPELTLRSTFITGFPGETDEDFEMLLEFLEAAQLDRVGCFTYSAVAGAAANALPDHVPAELAAERQEILMHAQQAISAARLRGKIGSEIEVLVDEVEPDRAIARGPGDAPEIDGQVFVETFEDLKPGDRVRVRVSGSSEHDLFAETI